MGLYHGTLVLLRAGRAHGEDQGQGHHRRQGKEHEGIEIADHLGLTADLILIIFPLFPDFLVLRITGLPIPNQEMLNLSRPVLPDLTAGMHFLEESWKFNRQDHPVGLYHLADY